jgi:hypothetical protein
MDKVGSRCCCSLFCSIQWLLLVAIRTPAPHMHQCVDWLQAAALLYLAANSDVQLATSIQLQQVITASLIACPFRC